MCQTRRRELDLEHLEAILAELETMEPALETRPDGRLEQVAGMGGRAEEELEAHKHADAPEQEREGALLDGLLCRFRDWGGRAKRELLARLATPPDRLTRIIVSSCSKHRPDLAARLYREGVDQVHGMVCEQALRLVYNGEIPFPAWVHAVVIPQFVLHDLARQWERQDDTVVFATCNEDGDWEIDERPRDQVRDAFQPLIGSYRCPGDAWHVLLRDLRECLGRLRPEYRHALGRELDIATLPHPEPEGAVKPATWRKRLQRAREELWESMRARGWSEEDLEELL